MNKYRFLLSLCFFVLCFAACKKQGGQAADFSYTGNALTGEKIQFTGTEASAGTKWLFGDGGSATGANATHVFLRKGFYKVSMIRPTDTVSKTLHISVGADRVAGTFHWNGYHFRHAINSTPQDTSYIIADTVFTITAINDSLIDIAGEHINYMSMACHCPYDSVLTFTNTFLPLSGKSIRYNYSNDSLYFLDDASGLGGQSYTLFRTKK